MLPDCLAPIPNRPTPRRLCDRSTWIRWKRGDRDGDLMRASQLWAEGLSVRQIGDALGLGKNRISGIVNRNRALFPARPSPIKRG